MESMEQQQHPNGESEVEVLTEYISAWNYQIVAIVWLSTCCLLLALTLSQAVIPLAIATFVVFIVFQYLAMKRRREVFK